jgi:hypothetical protein
LSAVSSPSYRSGFEDEQLELEVGADVMGVKVTGCPAVEGFCEGTTAVEEKTGR